MAIIPTHQDVDDASHEVRLAVADINNIVTALEEIRLSNGEPPVWSRPLPIQESTSHASRLHHVLTRLRQRHRVAVEYMQRTVELAANIPNYRSGQTYLRGTDHVDSTNSESSPNVPPGMVLFTNRNLLPMVARVRIRVAGSLP